MRAVLLSTACATLATLAATACTSPGDTGRTCGFPSLAHDVLVLESDRQTAALALLSGGCLTEAQPDLALGSDQNLFVVGGRPFVGVNDDGTLHPIDPATLTLTGSFDVYPGGSQTSGAPHSIEGVAVDGAGDLWISRGDVSSLVVLSGGGALVATVDLASLDPRFGNPRMNGILAVGGTVFVALGFLPTPVSDVTTHLGAVARISVATHKVEGTVDLHGHNPFGPLVPTGVSGEVVVATPGDFATIDMTGADGIDRVHLDGSQPTEQVVSEAELGGSVHDVVWASDHEAYAIVLGPGTANPTKVVALDPSQPPGRRVVRTLARAPSFVHQGLVLDGDSVAFADSTFTSPALHVVSRATHVEAAPIPATVLPPVEVVLLAP